ncbi:MAG: DUF1049 domain-containing protein [Actinomycetota bacterium]|nr:MAG: DUF1049 domain-containing protein [Actinomycetota bacterium]
MRIRVPGSKSRVENPKQSVLTEASSAEISPSAGNAEVEDRLETNQLNAAENVTALYPRGRIDSTRISRAWSRILPALILLAIILVFVFQNLGTAKVAFFMFSGTVPLALALIVAAALGAILVLTIGSIRIVQLRKIIHGRADSPATPEAKSSTRK